MSSLSKELFQDWDSNLHDARIRWTLVAFRFAQRVRKMNRLGRLVFKPYLMVYRFVVFGVFHMELRAGLHVGEGFRIFHGYCLVIHPGTKIGSHVTLRHCVTLGNKGSGGAPTIQDNVEVGANAVIIGKITIGEGAVIGAGSVVTKDILPHAVVAGNPARVLRIKPFNENEQ